MRTFNQILSDIPIGIVAINVRIEFSDDAIPFLLLSLAPGEELRSAVRVNPDVIGYSMVSQMRECEDQELESEG